MPKNNTDVKDDQSAKAESLKSFKTAAFGGSIEENDSKKSSKKQFDAVMNSNVQIKRKGSEKEKETPKVPKADAPCNNTEVKKDKSAKEESKENFKTAAFGGSVEDVKKPISKAKASLKLGGTPIHFAQQDKNATQTQNQNQTNSPPSPATNGNNGTAGNAGNNT